MEPILSIFHLSWVTDRLYEHSYGMNHTGFYFEAIIIHLQILSNP